MKLLCLALLVLVAHQAHTNPTTRVKHQRSVRNPVPKEDINVNLRRVITAEATTENLEATTRKPWTPEPRHEQIAFHRTYTDHNQLNRCKEGEFQCDVDLCVYEEKRCDGRVNCKDGTDEDDCVNRRREMHNTEATTEDIAATTRKPWVPEPRHGLGTDHNQVNRCKEGEFQCDDDLCVSEEKRCDGGVNCKDGTDEDDCDQEEKSIVRQGSCSTFTHATGTINYPSGGDNYPNDADLCWVINAETPIWITFTRFQVETNFDFLTIRDRTREIVKLSGHTLPPTVETSGNSAYLQFNSDYSVTFPGFELHWAPSGCGGTYTYSNGVIRYPLNGGNYVNNEDCVWKIIAAEPIKITFVRFDLEANYDFLYVRNGPSGDSPLLGSFNGDTNPNPVQTTQNSAFIRFASDYSVTKTGFELRWEPASDCACGQVNRASRIVNGVETEVNEYPWQAAIVYTSTSNIRCGGSVIGSKHILTAAHCTHGKVVTDFQVLVGAHQLSSPASSQIRFDAVRFINHQDYNPSTLDNDISIIELSSSIDFVSSEIRPVCLPENDVNSYDSVTATVSGWGRLEHGGALPDVLMEVDVPTITNTKCSAAYPEEEITDNMLCAGFDEGGKDSCQGDSGGPLYYNPGSAYTQIGVVSWGYGCALAGRPGVYARTSKYLTWIADNTASGTTCPAA